MLAGRMSNAEEDEVEEELEQLERQVNGVKEDTANKTEELPEAPTTDLPQKVSQKERWERRAREQEEAMLAA
jgi:charged multivesicular body protein 6